MSDHDASSSSSAGDRRNNFLATLVTALATLATLPAGRKSTAVLARGTAFLAVSQNNARNTSSTPSATSPTLTHVCRSDIMRYALIAALAVSAPGITPGIAVV